MTKCDQTSLRFPSVKRRKVEADFSGGDITSKGGIGLLAQVNWPMGPTEAVAQTLSDTFTCLLGNHDLQLSAVAVGRLYYQAARYFDQSALKKPLT